MKKQPVKKKLTATERKAALNRRKAKPEGAAATKKSAARSDGSKQVPQEKKLSLICAAARVLGEKKEPMTCKGMVSEVVAAGLWAPGAGKTPHATLYSAILRDLKSQTPRFEKVDRGLFTLAKTP